MEAADIILVRSNPLNVSAIIMLSRAIMVAINVNFVKVAK